MKNKKIEYPVVLKSGKSFRKMNRIRYRKMIESNKNLSSPIDVIKDRKERRALAKKLKVPFLPQYNGIFLKLKHEIYHNDKGYMRVKSIMEEVE